MPTELLIDSAKLRTMREAAGLTIEQTAVKAGITGSRLRQLASADKNARLNTVAQIADALGLEDPRDLLTVRRR